MKPFGIAGIQMNLSHGNNLDAIEQRINTVVSIYPWVEMIVLSELALFGPLHAYAQERPTESEHRLCQIAQRHGIWLITGSAFEKVDGKIYNTAAVINPGGEVVEHYSKLFPFRPYEQGIEAGDKFVVFDVPGAGRFGVCICYDMWFPEVPRTLTAMGAEVIIHPVLTGTNDRDIELNMARANGAIFQSYIIDINGLGVGGVGQSCIIGPDGRVVHQAGTGEEFLVAELDFDTLRRQRETGVRNLGQPLKSFRDSKTDIVVYHRRKWRNEYLNSLGPLATPGRDDKDKMAPVPADTGPPKSVKATKKRWR
jgi:predicted amidohydrolase